jgi:hypothetical protein
LARFVLAAARLVDCVMHVPLARRMANKPARVQC